MFYNYKGYVFNSKKQKRLSLKKNQKNQLKYFWQMIVY